MDLHDGGHKGTVCWRTYEGRLETTKVESPAGLTSVRVENEEERGGMVRVTHRRGQMERGTRILAFLALSAAVALSVSCDLVPPPLKSLALTGGEFAMYPAFNPFREHYAVHPGTTDQLRLTAVAFDDQNLISVNGRDWEKSSATVDLAEVAPGEDIHVTISTPSARKRTYVIHYLPEIFPEFDITATSEATAGLLFLTPRFTVDDVPYNYLMMLDNAGVPHWYDRAVDRVADLKLQQNGQVSYSQRTGRNEWGLSDSEIVLLDENLEVKRRLTTVDLTQTDHHDFRVTTEGNYMLISYHTEIRDLTAYGLSEDEPTGDSVIQEMTPEGQVVWEWSTWNNVPLEDFTFFSFFFYLFFLNWLVNYDNNFIWCI